MPVNGLLIDTDVLSYVAWQKPPAEAFEPLLVGKLPFVSFATVGEMYFGAAKANWGERRISKMETILGRYTVIPGTSGVARRYGDVRSEPHRVLRRLQPLRGWSHDRAATPGEIPG